MDAIKEILRAALSDLTPDEMTALTMDPFRDLASSAAK